ncbi:WcaI family glycosyltransferase [Pyruvatibacter sp.]|uniref:WcaI family glycosyltransferase n=1 Tax=Pyruvatibacter sp. TaxID=1981328 RepID=UPI0032EB4BDA
MRILIHGINYAPDEIGIPKYTSEMARWLAARGHDIRVVTAPPYYPEWKIRAGYTASEYVRDAEDRIRILRCPIYVPANPSGPNRLLHLASFALTSAIPLAWIAARWRPHLVIGIAPALAAAPATWGAARLGGAVAWLHVQDFELDAAFELGLLSHGSLRRTAKWIERRILKRFDHVSTISAKMAELLEKKGVAPQNIHELRNWVDVTSIHPLTTPSPYRAQWNASENDIICLYSGNIANKQGMEVIIDAARLLAHRTDIRFVICGNGSGRDTFAQAARTHPNISLLPLQPLGKLNDLLGAADIHMLPQKAGATDLVLPSKLTGMLASGRPVVATAAPGSGLATEIEDCGVATAPGDAQAFAIALEKLADDGLQREMLGRKAHAAAMFRLDMNAILLAAEGAFLDSVPSRRVKADKLKAGQPAINNR